MSAAPRHPGMRRGQSVARAEADKCAAPLPDDDLESLMATAQTAWDRCESAAAILELVRQGKFALLHAPDRHQPRPLAKEAALQGVIALIEDGQRAIAECITRMLKAYEETKEAAPPLDRQRVQQAR
jgi:hypothetical protein